MNKAPKTGARSKLVKKTGKTAAVKKRSKTLVAGKPLSDAERLKLKLDAVPLAEVEVLAARAVRLIKASKKLSADEKAEKLARVARTLGNARNWGALSKCGASMLKRAHLPPQPFDLEALKAVRAA